MFSSIFFLFGAMFCRLNLFSWGLSLMFLIGITLKSVPLYLVTFLEVGSLSWSWGLTLLSLISIVLVTYVSSQTFTTTSQYWMFFTSALLLISLILCFNVNNMILFYTFFELSALIIFLMVLSLGYQPERLEASLYLLLFTVFTSLPFFGVVLILSTESGLVEFTLLKNNSSSGLFPESSLFSLMLVIGVLTKFPMYFVHIWLPKAHVEASTTGSMLLAGVLLKLGSFGIGRLLGLLSLTSFTQFLAFFALVGGALISMLCVRMTDLKMLVAYSSVAHMSLVITGMLSLSFLGQMGGLAMSISHGITSSALFFGAGSLYSQSNSRLSLLNSGCSVWAPSFTFFWFIFCCSNMGTPPSLNFWAEVILLFSIVSSSMLSVVGLGVSLFFAVAFNMVMYSMSQSQKEVSALNFSLNFSLKDQGVFLIHLIWLLLLTFFLDIMFKYSENSNSAMKYLNPSPFPS